MFSIGLRLVVLVFGLHVGLVVSNEGSDTTCGSDSSTPCETISHASSLGESPRQVMVDAGLFEETQGVTVEGTLNIIGQSSSRCTLTKMNDTSFNLFTISESAKLNLTSLTILLTDDTSKYFLYGTGGHIVMNECQVTMRGGGDGKHTLTGMSFYIFTSANIAFEINACIIYNITTLQNTFIRVGNENVNLSFAKSSFVNVKSRAQGGCFYIYGSSDVSLRECFFSECSSITDGGIGYMDGVGGSGCTIQSCTFLNISCAADPGGGGVLFMDASSMKSLTISKTSFINCNCEVKAESGGNGGVLYLNSSIKANLSNCSFSSCNGYNGGGFYMGSSCTADISRCTFIECSAKNLGGAMYVNSTSNVSITDSVFLANSGNSNIGKDLYMAGTSLTFLRTFTNNDDIESAVGCGDCDRSGLHAKAEYDNSTCDDSFSNNTLEDCQMPCAGTDSGSEMNPSVCVKPDGCPSGFAALAGRCVPMCIFSAPINEACVKPCVADFSLGYPLCVPCAARKADSTQILPCGSSHCFQQINYDADIATLNSSCGESCDDAHYVGSEETGVCVLKSCAARTYVSTLPSPCGSDDCVQQMDKDGQPTTKCDVKQNSNNNNSSKSNDKKVGIIVGVVVPVSVVVLVVMVIAVVVLWKRWNKGKKLEGGGGTKFGEGNPMEDYEMKDLLGRGAFGRVYRARSISTGELYAVKILEKGNRTLEQEREFATIYRDRIDSDFLVKCYSSAVNKNGEQCLVLELCEHGDLRKLLKEIENGGPDAILNPQRIMKITLQTILGLQVLHKNRIVHRDLRPENVFVNENDEAKIGDLGCAVMLGIDLPTKLVGGHGYISPEMLKGLPYNDRTDLWSLGVMLYEMCMLKRPYDDERIFLFADQKFTYDPIPIERAPKELSAIISSLLIVEPKQRPSVADLFQNSFIREYAEKLNMLELFPLE